MKYRNTVFKLIAAGLIAATVFVTNFADAYEAPVTPQNDTNPGQVVGDFTWSSCGGFCSQ